MPYTPPADSLANAWEIIRKINEPNIGLLIDVWQWGGGDHSYEALADIPANKITGVQLGDTLPEPLADIIEESHHDRLLPSKGGVNAVHFLNILSEHAVPAPLSVEVMSDKLDTLSPLAVAKQVAAATRAVLGAV